MPRNIDSLLTLAHWAELGMTVERVAGREVEPSEVRRIGRMRIRRTNDEGLPSDFAMRQQSLRDILTDLDAIMNGHYVEPVVDAEESFAPVAAYTSSDKGVVSEAVSDTSATDMLASMLERDLAEDDGPSDEDLQAIEAGDEHAGEVEMPGKVEKKAKSEPELEQQQKEKKEAPVEKDTKTPVEKDEKTPAARAHGPKHDERFDVTRKIKPHKLDDAVVNKLKFYSAIPADTSSFDVVSIEDKLAFDSFADAAVWLCQTEGLKDKPGKYVYNLSKSIRKAVKGTVGFVHGRRWKMRMK